MGTPKETSLIDDILLKRGYVSVISGEPGTGKTFLCLKTAIKAKEMGDDVVYYTFNEGSSCLKERLRNVFNFEKEIRIKEGLSLAGEGVAVLLEDMIGEATKGHTIIVDSVDALMVGVPAGHEYRAVLQSLYRTVKNSRARLILVSESPDPYSVVGYAADSYISLHRETFMEHNYRYAYIKKARDVRIEYPFVPFSLFNGFTELNLREKGVTVFHDHKWIFRRGGRYIMEIDSSVPYHFMNFQRRATAALFLRLGRGVAYFTSPEETKDEIVKNVRDMLDDPSLLKNFVVVTRKEGVESKVDWKRFYRHRNKIMDDLKKVTGKPPVSLFTMWFNNRMYRELDDLYPELILSIIKKDMRDGTISLGYTVEGLAVNRIERQIANEYFFVRQRHGKVFIVRSKQTTKMAAYMLHEEEGRPAFTIIPIY